MGEELTLGSGAEGGAGFNAFFSICFVLNGARRSISPYSRTASLIASSSITSACAEITSSVAFVVVVAGLTIFSSSCSDCTSTAAGADEIAGSVRLVLLLFEAEELVSEMVIPKSDLRMVDMMRSSQLSKRSCNGRSELSEHVMNVCSC